MRVLGAVVLVALVLGLGVAAITPGNPVYDAVQSADDASGANADGATNGASNTAPPADQGGASEPPTDAGQAAAQTPSDIGLSDISPPGDAVQAVATDIKDGDSFEVSWPNGRPAGVNRDEIRLQNINTPEFGDCFASEAGDALVALIDGQTLDVDIVATERNDGRQIADVWVDGTFVNLVMIAQGNALALSFDSPFLDDLRQAQRDAQDAGRGIWSTCTSANVDIAITGLEHDPRGRDDFAMNEEWVEVTNISDGPLDLTGWTLRDESTFNRFRFPDGFTLGSGDSVRVRSGDSEAGFDGLFWGAFDPVWNNGGDTAYVLDADGLFVDWWGY